MVGRSGPDRLTRKGIELFPVKVLPRSQVSVLRLSRSVRGEGTDMEQTSCKSGSHESRGRKRGADTVDLQGRGSYPDPLTRYSFVTRHLTEGRHGEWHVSVKTGGLRIPGYVPVLCCHRGRTGWE